MPNDLQELQVKLYGMSSRQSASDKVITWTIVVALLIWTTGYLTHRIGFEMVAYAVAGLGVIAGFLF